MQQRFRTIFEQSSGSFDSDASLDEEIENINDLQVLL